MDRLSFWLTLIVVVAAIEATGLLVWIGFDLVQTWRSRRG